MRWLCSLARLKMSEQVKLHFTAHNFFTFLNVLQEETVDLKACVTHQT